MSNLTKKQEELKASLKHGDRGKIAKQLLMKRQELAMVLKGEKEDERVWKAIEELIAARPQTEAKPQQEGANLQLEKAKRLLHLKIESLNLLGQEKQNLENLLSHKDQHIAHLERTNKDLEKTLSNLQQQYSNAQEHIIRSKMERDELKERLKELMAERGQKGLSYDLVETLLAIPNTDLQVKMLHEIKQQFLA